MPEIVIPQNSEELGEMLHDGKRMGELFNELRRGNKEPWANFIKTYARVTMEKDDSIGEQVRNETRSALAEWRRENGVQNKIDLNPMSNRQIGKNKLWNKNAPGAQVEKVFEDSSEIFQALYARAGRSVRRKDPQDLKDKLAEVQKIMNTFSSEIPSDGGFLVPETMRSEILSVSLENSIVRPLARVIPMESLRVPIPSIDSTSDASSVFGGIVAYWTAEGAALTASNPTFGRVQLEAKKLTAYAEAPNELVSDATAFGSFFDQLFPEAVSFYEDQAFLTGTGAGEPKGVLNSQNTGLITVSATASGNNVEAADIFNMYQRMLPSSLGRAVWVAAIDTFSDLSSMTVGSGGAAPAVWLNNGQMISGPPMTLLGRPVYFTEKVPGVGNAKQISFIDFGYYLIGDRQAMTAATSQDYLFKNDEIAFRLVQRVDGQPWLQSAITPANGSTSTLSAYVTLGAD